MDGWMHSMGLISEGAEVRGASSASIGPTYFHDFVTGLYI